jgi:hypothetical protein
MPTAEAGSRKILLSSLNTMSWNDEDPTTPGYPSYWGNFTTTVTLRDSASGKTGTLVFNDFVLGEGCYNPVWGGDYTSSPKSLTLGGNVYTVTQAPPLLPPVQKFPNEGSFNGTVTVTPASAPEPSTLVLCGLGILGLAIVCGVKRGRSAMVDATA